MSTKLIKQVTQFTYISKPIELSVIVIEVNYYYFLISQRRKELNLNSKYFQFNIHILKQGI